MEKELLIKLNKAVFAQPWGPGLVRFFANWFIWLTSLGVLAAMVADPLLLIFLIEESPDILLGLLLARGVIAPLLHMLIPRQRPYTTLEVLRIFVPHGKRSFPSGHATFFAALAFAVLPIASWAGTILLVAAALNGVARILGALHWPSDVLGGFAVGYLGVWLAIEIFSYIPAEDLMAWVV